MMTNYLVGLDCGASHSSITIWDQGDKVFERHDWPGANLDLIEFAATKEYFLLEFEKLTDYQNAYWVVGMAGLDDSREVTEAETWFRGVLDSSLPYSGLTVVSDIEMVLWAGSPTGVGIGVIAGTGSNCLGRNGAGKTKKTGGMSHLLSDEGSGFALGWKGLHLFMKMSDGRLEKTDLFLEVLETYGVGDAVDLKNYLLKQDNQKQVVAKCAPLVLAAASRGEEEAGRILNEESLELVKMVATVNETFPNDSLPVFLAGGLFKNIDYRDQFIINLHKFFPSQRVRVVSAIEGVISLYNHISENKTT